MFHHISTISLISRFRKLALGILGCAVLTILFVMCKPVQRPSITGLAIPVYPGAEGFGSLTVAGRGGEVVVVTNLDDSGRGSLRHALAIPRPRIVVFEVGGTIALEKNLSVDNPYVTIAGQTAPSPGITLKGAGLVINTHDVLLQHIRIRPGDTPGGPSPDDRDALLIQGPSVFNVVVDHISASWAIDENFSTNDALHGLTISNSIISEALNTSLHSKGPHSCGLLVGDRSKNIFIKSNLLAHNVSRNPRIKGATSVLFVNNVVYDARSPYVSIGSDSGPAWVTLVGNVFIDGPSTGGNYHAIKVEGTAAAGTEVYQADNRSTGGLLKKSAPFDPVVPFPPIWFSPMTLHDSRAVEQLVAKQVGARPMDRDIVDRRVVNNVLSRSGRVVDTQEQVDGWPTARSYRAFVVPSDAHEDDDGDGYSNVEEILHGMLKKVEGTDDKSAAMR